MISSNRVNIGNRSKISNSMYMFRFNYRIMLSYKESGNAP